MIVKKLKLTNFGKHKYLELNNLDESSIIGIFGNNGCGKSTILTAIDFAFSKTLSDNIESYIHAGEKTGEVYIEFIKSGKVGKITRKLGKSTSSTLEWEDTIYTKSAEIDEKINEILGVDKQMLSNTVFIKQGAISKLLKSTTASRVELLSKLLNLSYINKRFQIVDEEYKNLKDSTIDISIYKDDLNNIIEDINSKTKDIETNYNNLNSLYGSKENVENFLNNIKKYKELVKEKDNLISEISKYEQLGINDFNNLEKKEFESLEELNKVIHLVNVFANKVEEGKDYVSYKELLNKSLEEILILGDLYYNNLSITKIDKKVALLLENIENIKKYKNAILSLPTLKEKISINSKDLDSELTKLDTVNKSIDNKTKELSLNHSILQNLETLYNTKLKLKNKINKDSVTCPICGLKLLLGQEITDGDVSSLKCNIESINNICNQLKLELDNLNKEHQEINNNINKYKAEKIFFSNKIEELNNIIKTTHKDIIDLNSEELYKELDKLTTLSITYKKYLSKSLERDTILNEVFNFFSKYTGSHEYTAEENEAIRTKLLELNVKSLELKNEYDNIKLEVNKIKQQHTTYLANKNQLSYLNDNINKLELTKYHTDFISLNKDVYNKPILDLVPILENILDKYKSIEVNELSVKNLQDIESKQREKIQRIEQENKNKYDLLLQLATLRECLNFKSDFSLPRSYIDYLFEIITDKVSSILSEMDSDFIIDVEDKSIDSCAFKFRRLDSDIWLPMSKLSGGQQIKVAIALLLGIHEVICPNLGLLVLDEPSTHLDAKSVDALSLTLKDINKILHNKNNQIWIVDHNENLISCCDKHVSI